MKKINWVDHLIAFVVVVIGIFIAFQLNSYSESVRQRKTIRNHLANIKEETKSNKALLDSAIRRSEAVLGLTDEVLQHIKNQGSPEKLNTYIFRLMEYNNVYIRKNAYLTLIESGDVRWINDYELKTKTINLYEYYKWTLALEKIASDVLIEQYYPYIRKNMDFLNMEVQERDVYYNKEFVNSLATYRYSLNGKIIKYRDCSQQMDDYLALLDEKGF